MIIQKTLLINTPHTLPFTHSIKMQVLFPNLLLLDIRLSINNHRLNSTRPIQYIPYTLILLYYLILFNYLLFILLPQVPHTHFKPFYISFKQSIIFIGARIQALVLPLVFFTIF